MHEEIKLPLTIEGQLERYYKNSSHTERHEILWHAWNQNKRWINEFLQMTLTSFPTYSKHDESHALAVLHNIEMILGEDRIAKLSASDCFALLHTVYIHDIGMCITYQDRENIVKNRKFMEMVDELEEEGDNSLSDAIEALKRTDYSFVNEEDEIIKTQKLYEDKLKVYYALIYAISNYTRAEHGVRSKERLQKWTLEPDKLGIGFSLSGIPLRIFLAIANSAQLHTNPKFEEILNLPQEDDGFALDYYHPRFISVLLQLGDILDMDNNRFHPLTKECMGSLPELSEQHYDKHLAIRRLHIRPDKISIEADCQTQESLRLVRKECDMLINMLKSAGFYWSVICPPDFSGTLPTVDTVRLALNGQMIPEELVSTQFKISQKKAFSLLEGANVYSGRFVFLREFLQNAVDATKMQYWNECCSTKAYYDSTKLWKKANPNDLNKKVKIENFPIEIEMQIQKRDRNGELSEITEEDIKQLDENKNTCTYGVKVRIKDFGTGIDKDRILNISKVGSSRKDERELIETMPEWLRPTAEFGVGLQSAFLLTGSFRCFTHTRTGQRYEITFGAVSTSRYEGYINVKPVDKFEEQEDTFGTCFEVFVPYNKKFLHQDCFEAWDGEDAFDEYYELRRPLRHSAELLAQMALYLDKQVGELLFPVRLHVKECKFIDCFLNKNEKNQILYIDMDYGNKKSNVQSIGEENETVDFKKFNKFTFKDKKRIWKNDRSSWIYFIDKYKNTGSHEETILCGEIENIIYLLDYDSGELHIWDGERCVFATVSAKNLMLLEKIISGSKQEEYPLPNGTRVYYKGIALQRRVIEEDSELIEYIDIKGGLKREYINLSRNGFTVEGERYFKQNIYAPILQSTKKILKYIAKQFREGKNVLPSSISKSIKNKCKQFNVLENEIHEIQKETVEAIKEHGYMIINEKELQRRAVLKQLEQQIISIVMLCYLAMREHYDQIGCVVSDNNSCPWIETIAVVRGALNEHNRVLEALKKESNFFNLISYEETCNYQFGHNEKRKDTRRRITFADIFSPNYSYAIVQVRESQLRPWKQYLIQLSSGVNILSQIAELKFIRDKYSRQKSEENIEAWGTEILKNARNFREAVVISDDSKQQFIIKWLQKSVPTIGVFANEDGNIRINVLSNKTMPYLYANKNFKILIAQRMLEMWKRHGIKRFSTCTWHSNMYLGCENVPFKIFCVKRGYMGMFTLNRTIVPIGETEFSSISSVLQQEENNLSIKRMIDLYENISIEEYLQKRLTVNGEKDVFKELLLYKKNSVIKADLILKEIQQIYLALIMSSIRKQFSIGKYNDWTDIGKREEFIITEGDKNEWNEICRRIIEFLLENYRKKNIEFEQGDLEALTDTQAFDKLCEAWIYLSYNFTTIDKEKLQIQTIRKDYFDSLKHNSRVQGVQRRIHEYVREFGSHKLTLDNIESCYIQFAEELFDLYEELEIRRNREILDRVNEKDKNFLRQIAKFFNSRVTKEEKYDGE